MEPASFGQVSTNFRFKKPGTLAKQRGRAVGVSPHVVVTGLTAVSASFLNAAERTQNDAVTVTDQAAQSLRAAQFSSAPVLSGETRGSIVNTVEARYNGYARSVGPTHFVARFLVFGTVKMSRKWDFFGASQPTIERWQTEMTKVAKIT